MGPAPVVVRDPLFEKTPEVPLIQRDQEIQAFTAHCTYHSLTERVRLGSLKWRLQNPQVHGLQCRIELRGVDAVPVVEHKPVGVWAPSSSGKIRNTPFCFHSSTTEASKNMAE